MQVAGIAPTTDLCNHFVL